ncbi:hypothetical protein C6P40_000165 [Pichia californica]|uniref:Peroxin-14 n=1 Tax=Pichia californica TaxID=460514 RepID=A0A9P6WNR1_9ASCO|nr:hypothetical protein C6P42_003651 [[Candida] californica]KAG0689063.1 hypothetical protein C6P40_000165 [[Candida] californica]
MSRIPVIAFPEETSLPVLRTPTHPVIRYIKVLSRTTLLTTLVIYLLAKFLLSPALSTILKRRSEFNNTVYTRLKILHKTLKSIVKNPPNANVSYNGKKLVDRTICTDDVIMEETREYELEQFKKNNQGKRYPTQFSIDNIKEVRFADEAGSSFKENQTFDDLQKKMSFSSTKLDTNIDNLKSSLNKLKVSEYNQLSISGFNNGDAEMNSLLYQIKQLKTYLEVVTSEHPRDMLFKKPLYHIKLGNDDTNYKFNYLDILNDNINEMKRIIDSK